ncbi:MAG: hypothetical protein JW929_03455 [Anaerolineales bacterium]|nr:hypothetical protein [Anaerolineales bacterium]
MKRYLCFLFAFGVFCSACSPNSLTADPTVSSAPTTAATPQPSLTPTPTPTPTAIPLAPEFSFKPYLSRTPAPLRAYVESINLDRKQVRINGADDNRPTKPFSFDWGDGKTDKSFFPAIHVYADASRNYIVRIESGAHTFSVSVVFVPVSLSSAPLPDIVRVSIPDAAISLESRLYPIGDYSYFDDSFFTRMSRRNIEYLLWIGAAIQFDLVNQDVFLVDGRFQQVVLRDPYAGGGMYSLWFTSPVALTSGDYGFTATPQYSSFFHEMGHNFTLNSPADYHYGGKIDGNANAIFSETMANIFAHATAFEILNHTGEYGIDPILALDIQNSAVSSIDVTRWGFYNYLARGKQFHSWDYPNTQPDDTVETFLTLAYVFCLHAEESDGGYRIPAQRMMRLLQKFNPAWQSLYSPHANSLQAESFRATLMVAAMSYGFAADLREEFRNLNFPVSDDYYASIMDAMEDS